MQQAVELVEAAESPIGAKQLYDALTRSGYSERAVRYGIVAELAKHGLLILNKDFTLGINTRLDTKTVNARLSAWDQRTIGKQP